jgi:hypothetical protein
MKKILFEAQAIFLVFMMCFIFTFSIINFKLGNIVASIILIIYVPIYGLVLKKLIKDFKVRDLK